MAVVLITSVKTFVGVSGDSKPADAPVGSTFYETDSRIVYVYDGTNWGIKLGEAI